MNLHFLSSCCQGNGPMLDQLLSLLNQFQNEVFKKWMATEVYFHLLLSAEKALA